MRTLLQDDYDSYAACLAQPMHHGIPITTMKISVEEFLTINPFHLRPVIDAIRPPNALVLRFLMRLANRAFLYAKGVFPRLSLHAPPNPMPGMRALYDKDLTGSDKRRAGQVVLSISVISRFARAAGGTGTAAGFTRETVGEPRSG